MDLEKSLIELTSKGKVCITVTGNGSYRVRFQPYNTIDSDKFLSISEDDLELALEVMRDKIREQTPFTL